MKKKYPTIADINDIISTLKMGTSGIVLAAETAIGKFPIQTVSRLKREKISTPSYYQVIQPIYKHADQRWKRYKKHLTNIQPNLSALIKKYKY